MRQKINRLIMMMLCGLMFIQPAWAQWEVRIVVLPLVGGAPQSDLGLVNTGLQDSAINVLKAMWPATTHSAGVLNRRYIYQELESFLTQISTFPEQSQLKAMAKKSTADYIFTGQTELQGTQVNVQAYVYITKTDTLTKIGQINGKINDMPDLQSKFVTKIIDALEMNLNETQKKNLAFYANPPLEPAYYQAYLQGIMALDKRDYETAISKLTQAIESNPNYAWPITQRGVAYLHSGKPEEAFIDFEKACDMGETDACAWQNVALPAFPALAYGHDLNRF